MGGTSIYRPRSYSVIVEFVPVTFDPKLGRAFESIEDANGLERGVLMQARFIKPLARRSPGQRSAHTIFGFKNAAAANHVIRHSLFIDGKRVPVRKLISEPIRCLKCQVVGTNHNAASCPASQDVCARCGEAHRTDTCQVNDTGCACANCMVAKHPHRGHGAADRNCPVFADKLQFALERNPDARYKYFPTDDPESWEPNEKSNAAINNQAATWQNGNTWVGGYA
ncbi:hypothetical protein B0H10DRAFT_1828590 [Mycena sp. CBHHK59/15]|nr:hypothetical protein B0H10DRAFT_1828590 [Mycena sp. CBHHK59/15]